MSCAQATSDGASCTSGRGRCARTPASPRKRRGDRPRSAATREAVATRAPCSFSSRTTCRPTAITKTHSYAQVRDPPRPHRHPRFSLGIHPSAPAVSLFPCHTPCHVSEPAESQIRACLKPRRARALLLCNSTSAHRWPRRPRQARRTRPCPRPACATLLWPLCAALLSSPAAPAATSSAPFPSEVWFGPFCFLPVPSPRR